MEQEPLKSDSLYRNSILKMESGWDPSVRLKICVRIEVKCQDLCRELIRSFRSSDGGAAHSNFEISLTRREYFFSVGNWWPTSKCSSLKTLYLYSVIGFGLFLGFAKPRNNRKSKRAQTTSRPPLPLTGLSATANS